MNDRPVNSIDAHSQVPGRHQERLKVRTNVPCPYCGADAGTFCIGSHGQKRYASHQERWDLYREWRDRRSVQ